MTLAQALPRKHMNHITIDYRQDVPLDPADVARVFDRSGIKRPTNDLARIARMFAAPSLLLSAWVDNELVGLSRSLTDHAYCCYLSDLAVDKKYQGHGIGRELVQRTQAIIGDEVSLILLSAPDAMSYYPTLGFELAQNAYVIRRKR
ncbi:Acetyltransferase (GNAT) family protein [compost metagenome]